ncbi:MAG: PDZ domain-containing protein [Phycisphaeraceae bacterium]|nr:PDZ domain-containing protein [Phycisphaeraceae bacterium]MCB9848873.1 PDZ domain-containing protein [Phycisphaeraceae bacterium]
MPASRRHQGRRTSCRALAVVALLALSPAGARSAWADYLRPDEIDVLVDQLADDDFASREEATQSLTITETDIEPLLKARLETGALTAEQLVRIETILQNRFYNSPRAALGVGFVPVNNQPDLPAPVVLNNVLQGFPCAATLKPGDIIRVVDGLELTSFGADNDVRTAILSHLPGEELELVIERDNRRSFVRVPLADYERLGNPPPPSTMLGKAWEFRKARLGLGATNSQPPIECPEPETRSKLPPLPARPAPKISAGGAPDNGGELLHTFRSQASTQNAPRISATNARPIIVNNLGQRVNGRAEALAVTPRARREFLVEQLKLAEENRDRFQLIIARNDIDPRQQQAAVAELTAIQASIAAIRNNIAAIDKKAENEAAKAAEPK